MRRALLFTMLLGGLLAPTQAGAISRQEVMVRAKAFAYHPWTCTSANLTASCAPTYQSEYVVGDYLGLPYDWGGYMGLFTFDQAIAQGAGAGSYPSDGILDCTVGLDCSGFVSQAWDVGHNTTSSLPDISDPINQSELLPADILNESGYHVVLFSHLLAGGEPVFYEAVGFNVHYSPFAGWSWVQGFIPRRFQQITGTSAGNPTGTLDAPIVISSFPYTDSRDTSQSSSSVLDGCGAAPATDESGPEVIYEVTFTQPGQLTVSVSDDANVDVDVHLYTSANTSDCVARDDSTFTQAVGCGTYLVVADTFGGDAQAGPYTLTVDFQPSGGTCGAGPPTYAFEGELGDPCGYPGNEALPFCNQNLGAEVCIYSSSDSFCSRSCAGGAECQAAFPGGCCADIGQNETYCLPADQCDPASLDGGVDGGVLTDGGVPGDPDAGGVLEDGGASEDGGGAGDASPPGADGGGGEGGGDGGCGCAAGPSDGAGGFLLLLLLFLLWRPVAWRRCRQRGEGSTAR